MGFLPIFAGNTPIRIWGPVRSTAEKLPMGRKYQSTASYTVCSARPGDVFTLAFHGTAVGAYLLAGPDAGTVEARIDNGTFQSVSLYHRFSKGLHYPRTVLFATDLSSGNHLLTVRISAETKSTGNAVRIMKFVAN